MRGVCDKVEEEKMKMKKMMVWMEDMGGGRD